MKKLLGLGALATVLFLTACGGSDTVTTTCEADIEGMVMTMTAESEDGEINSFESEVRFPLEMFAMFGLDVADLDLDSDEIAGALAMMGLDGDVTLDGDYMVVVMSGTPEDFGFDSDLDSFIADTELMGGTCN